ncbi:MAG TPA: hypothetical protein ENI92_07265 [Bacteroidetes bacterium]|nr:hypothetical protein [Bacteroidota bacterium]
MFEDARHGGTTRRGRLAALWLLSLLLLVPVPAPAAERLYLLPREVPGAGKTSPIERWTSKVPGAHAIRPAFPAIPHGRAPRLARWLVLDVESRAAAGSLLRRLAGDPEVEAVERPPERHLAAYGIAGAPNDPLADYQWHLAAIDAYAAWDLVPDASQVVLAVVDNGFDMAHPDLAPVLWTNEEEADGAMGVDDDGNGYVDDIHGWDAYEQDGDPTGPTNVQNKDHGTHVAGIAGAAHNNHRGVSGVAPGVRLMMVRAGNGGDITTGFEGILYAVENGADVISLSWGGQTLSTIEWDVIRYAVQRGAVIVAAAGNLGSSAPYYPAAYEEVIAVASTGPDDHLSTFSNRGWWVDIAAPGEGIYSTIINGYGTITGTSMSTPVVSGVAAMLLAVQPGLSPTEVLARLSQGSMEVRAAGDSQTHVGRVNAWRSVTSGRPALALRSLGFEDGDGDGTLEPGEAVAMTVELELAGGPAETVSIRLVGYDTAVTSAASFTWNQAAPGVLRSDPLLVFIAPDASRGTHPLWLAADADGWLDTLVVRVPVDPPWRTHDAGGMRASFTDFGAIGYWDYMENRETPDGVTLAGRPFGLLFHGSVMVTDGAEVSDCAYGGLNEMRYDFVTGPGGEIRAVEAPEGMQVYEAAYNDLDGLPTTGVRVHQRTTSYPEGNNFVLIDLEVTREIPGSADYAIGLYCDWDIHPLETNTVGYDEELHLSYMLGDDGAAGLVSLDGPPLSVRAVDNVTVQSDGFSDAERRDILLGGTDEAVSDHPADWSHAISLSLGPISDGETRTARFALVAASTLGELYLAASEALAAGGGGAPAAVGKMPSRFQLAPAWPNPFNSSTRVTAWTSRAGPLSLEVYNLLGRRVAMLHGGPVAAGLHRFRWDGRTGAGAPAASGTYLLVGVFGDRRVTRRVVLLR